MEEESAHHFLSDVELRFPFFFLATCCDAFLKYRLDKDDDNIDEELDKDVLEESKCDLVLSEVVGE